MKSTYRWISRGALCLASLALQPKAFAAELTLPRDGWISWQVAAVDAAPDWCCWRSSNNFRDNLRDAPRTACKLDGRQDSWGNRDNETTDQVRIYARTAGGKLDRLRVLSVTCPAEAATPIRDLGTVTQNDSARWLVGLAKQKNEDVLTALAINRGDVARDALSDIARNDTRGETRQQAVFWLAQVRGQEGADIASSIMFNDKDPEVREHAAFALSQSETPRAEADLTRLLNTDKDDEVREGAVFALSQLPDERATRALIATAENRSLARELRKKAVFWLSQSESDAAQKYLERVLTANH
jgi:HEAT repeat protein